MTNTYQQEWDPFEFVIKMTINNENQLGEALRNEFFQQDLREGAFGQVVPSFGCYSTFELRDGVEELPDEDVYNGDEIDEYNVWTCAKKIIQGKEVKMRYYWDGDGTLQFILPRGWVLENTDCKKNNHWTSFKEGER